MVNPQGYQFDLRRDIQATIGNTIIIIKFLGGLNASLGLAFGLTQMMNLGTIGLKL